MFYKLRELFEYTTNKEIVFHKSIDEIFKELIFKDIGENFFNIFPNEEEWSIYGLESEEVKEVLYEALTVFGNPSEIKVLDMQPEAYKSFIINLIKENTTPIIKGGVKRIGNAQVYFKYDLNIGIIYLYENDDVIYKISTNGAKYTLQSNLLATIKERLKFTYVMLYFIFKTDMLSIEAKERHLQPYLTFGKQRKYTYLDLVDFEGLYKGYIHLKEQVSIPYYDLPEYLLTQSDLVSVLGLEKLDAVEIDEEILCTLQSVGTFIYRDLIASKDNYKGANKLSIQESISTATLKSLLGLKRGEYIYPGKTNYGGKLNKTFLLGYPDFLNVVMENNFGDDYLDHLLEVQFFFDWGVLFCRNLLYSYKRLWG